MSPSFWFFIINMDRFHIVPYPVRGYHPSRNKHFENRFRRMLGRQGNTDGFGFEGYWIAIQLYGGERGLKLDLPLLGKTFYQWIGDHADIVEAFREQARQRG